MMLCTEYAPSITRRSRMRWRRMRWRRDVIFSSSLRRASSHVERMSPLICSCLKVGVYCSRPIILSSLKTCTTQINVALNLLCSQTISSRASMLMQIHQIGIILKAYFFHRIRILGRTDTNPIVLPCTQELKVGKW